MMNSLAIALSGVERDLQEEMVGAIQLTYSVRLLEIVTMNPHHTMNIC
jgi:hypothetical protein